MAASKVSFTIRRPTPVSRATSTGVDSDASSFKIPALPPHLASAGSSAPGSPLRVEYTGNYVDSSDEEDGEQDELVTGFDQFGVQRAYEKKVKPTGPLVIPALQNRDWREMARARRQGVKARFVPESAKAVTGADGSVGGLSTRDTINAGPQREGLQMVHRAATEPVEVEPSPVSSGVQTPGEPETEDQRAIRALLAGSDVSAPELEAIPLQVSEDDAYHQDVDDLPEEATLADYDRVPVEQFGAALLRGMGWTEGQAASKRWKGPVEPWVPVARPALLGLGAKEKEVFDDGSKKKGKSRPERRYVPVVKKGDDAGYENGREREGHRDRDKDSRRRDRDYGDDRRNRSHDRDDRRERDKYGRERDYDRTDHRDRDKQREHSYSHRDRERSPQRDRDRNRRDK